MDDVSALLDAPTYRETLAEISRRSRIALDPEYTPTLQSFDEADLALSGVPVATLHEVLESDREAVIRFGLERLRKSYGIAMEEEYPPGEAPDPADLPVVLKSHGVGRGFLLLTLIDYFLLKERPEALNTYLKARRIPKAKQFAAELRALFDKARAAQR